MIKNSDKPTVKLIGKNGNVFNLLGLCHEAARKAGWEDEEWEGFYGEATSGDYDHALATMQKYFNVQ